jgi:UDP-glucose 4-epimerase
MEPSEGFTKGGCRMAIMVIGGTGFIGSRVCKKLVDLGEEVVAFDRDPSAELLGEYADRVKLVGGDKTAIEDIIRAIKDNSISKIIDLAYVLEVESMMQPYLAVKVNIMGTNNVFEAARLMGVDRVLFASSITAYGHHDHFGEKALDEDDPLYPMSIYGSCKAFCEYMVKFYHDVHGLDFTALRVGSAFGPGRTGGATAFVSNISTLPALGQPLFIPPKETSYFVYSSVDDVARAFVTACQAEPGPLKHYVYNIGGHTHRGDEVASRIKELVPDADITFGDLDLYYVYRLDNSRIKQDLGFDLTLSMEDGLKENINETRRKNDLPEV